MRRWLRRRWRWVMAHWEAYKDRRFERREWQRIHQEEALERMQAADAAKLALARSMIEQLGPEYREALTTVAAAEVREQVYAQALAEARASLEADVERRRERLAAEKAAYQARLDREYEARDEERVRRAREQARQAVEGELDEARTAAAQALAAQQQTERPLVGLVRALLPEGRKTYLGRLGVPELDVYGLNRVLRRQAVEIDYDFPSRDVPGVEEYAELVVRVKTGEAAWGSATRFWLQKVEPPEEVLVNGIPAKYVVRPGA